MHRMPRRNLVPMAINEKEGLEASASWSSENFGIPYKSYKSSHSSSFLLSLFLKLIQPRNSQDQGQDQPHRYPPTTTNPTTITMTTDTQDIAPVTKGISPTKPTRPERIDIGDGLIMRWSTKADAKNIADCMGECFKVLVFSLPPDQGSMFIYPP